MEAGKIISQDGQNIFYRSYKSQKSFNTLVLLHGFAEHSGRYDHIIQNILNTQTDVCAIDFRGHGHSSGTRGYIDSIEQYLFDVDAAVEFAKKLNKKNQVFILAHSMGGLIAALYTEKYPEKIRGLILSSPFFGIKKQIPKWKIYLGNIMSKYMPQFALSHEIKGSELTQDLEMARRYDFDPLIFRKIKARWFTEMQNCRQKAIESAYNIKTPLLLQASLDDNVVDVESSKIWFEKFQGTKTFKGYKGFFHEIYNEKERARPIFDLETWLNAQNNI